MTLKEIIDIFDDEIIKARRIKDMHYRKEKMHSYNYWLGKEEGLKESKTIIINLYS